MYHYIKQQSIFIIETINIMFTGIFCDQLSSHKVANLMQFSYELLYLYIYVEVETISSPKIGAPRFGYAYILLYSILYYYSLSIVVEPSLK